MLVIGRKVEEEIVIFAPDGTPIVLVVANLGRREVAVGIKAPLAYRIYRSELLTTEPRREED